MNGSQQPASSAGESAPGPAPGPGRSARHACLPLVVVLAGAAGFGFHRVFSAAALAPTVVVASVVPVVVVLLVSGRRRPSPLWPSIVLTVVCWLVTVSATLFRADAAGGLLPTSRTLNRAPAALVDSWKAILTTIPPLPADPDLLVLVHASVWLAAFAGAELVLRTRTIALPAVPAVAVFCLALAVGVRGAGSYVPSLVALMAAAGLLMLLRTPAGHRTGHALVTGLPYLAVLTLVAVLAGPHLPLAHARPPFDPASRVRPPEPARPAAINPLDEVSAWLQNPKLPLFTVAADSGGQDNWRLVVLDRFDGVTWSPTPRLVRTGGRVPPAPSGPASGESVRLDQQVTIEGLAGVWLPAADRPESVTPATGVPVGDLTVDPDTGIVAAGTALRHGMRYRVVSAVARYRAEELQTASVADDPAAQQAMTLPAAAAEAPVSSVATIRQRAQEATVGSSFPYQQAARLADYLRKHYRYDAKAAPGHTYRSVEFFLETTRQGTFEQFATAFAVMARSLGLPTRVVVGFRPGFREADSWQVRSGDVLVWAEVAFKGVGWVPFYPTPGKSAMPEKPAEVPGQSANQQKIEEALIEPVLPAPPAPDPSPQPAPPARGIPWQVVALVGAGVVAGGYCAAMLAAPWWRRRRRARAIDPGQRVLGAWAQTTDRLRDVGLASRALTATEVVAFGSARLGRHASKRLHALGLLTNEVVFSGRQPAPAAGEVAWKHCAAVERAVRRSLPRRTRLRLRMAPWTRPPGAARG
jgi:transglutaminase-like putative cysteine protease